MTARVASVLPAVLQEVPPLSVQAQDVRVPHHHQQRLRSGDRNVESVEWNNNFIRVEVKLIPTALGF